MNNLTEKIEDMNYILRLDNDESYQIGTTGKLSDIKSKQVWSLDEGSETLHPLVSIVVYPDTWNLAKITSLLSPSVSVDDIFPYLEEFQKETSDDEFLYFDESMLENAIYDIEGGDVPITQFSLVGKKGYKIDVGKSDLDGYEPTPAIRIYSLQDFGDPLARLISKAQGKDPDSLVVLFKHINDKNLFT